MTVSEEDREKSRKHWEIEHPVSSRLSYQLTPEGKLIMSGNLSTIKVKVSIDKIRESVRTGKYAAVYEGLTHTHKC